MLSTQTLETQNRRSSLNLSTKDKEGNITRCFVGLSFQFFYLTVLTPIPPPLPQPAFVCRLFSCQVGCEEARSVPLIPHPAPL